MARNILILGASYGSLLATKLLMAGHNVTLTTNAIKTKLGLDLSAEEQRIEDAFRRGEDVAAAVS